MPALALDQICLEMGADHMAAVCIMSPVQAVHTGQGSVGHIAEGHLSGLKRKMETLTDSCVPQVQLEGSLFMEAGSKFVGPPSLRRHCAQKGTR